MRVLRFTLMVGIVLGLLVETVGVSAQEDDAAPQPPTEFTGTLRCGPPVSPDRAGTEERLEVGDEGLVLTRGRRGAWRQSGSFSDPRLEGAVYATFQWDNYAPSGAGVGPSVTVFAFRIENEEGAWQALGHNAMFGDGTSTEAPVVLIGEGAYEGLVAIFEGTEIEPCGQEVRGIIFDHAPVPEAYTPE
jgi:hypothetical protein